MKEVAAETEKLYRSTRISDDERNRLQKMRQAVAMMKKVNRIYLKSS
jgi:hypothetical protein